MNYSRHSNIFDMGILKSAHITIVGASQIGSHLALYASGLGIGSMSLVDETVVNEISKDGGQED